MHAALAALLLGATAAAAAAPALPDFPHGQPADWINSAPLTTGALRGRAVLVEFWAFECSNCLATVPWLKSIAARYRDRGLVVIGVHTPELAAEYDPRAVRGAVTRLGINYPVMLDADYAFWRALDNRYWPALYLYGTDGRLVTKAVGELHAGDQAAQAFEARIVDSLPARDAEASLRPAPER